MKIKLLVTANKIKENVNRDPARLEKPVGLVEWMKPLEKIKPI